MLCAPNKLSSGFWITYTIFQPYLIKIPHSDNLSKLDNMTALTTGVSAGLLKECFRIERFVPFPSLVSQV
jgi:hypothetical protein